MFYYWQDISLWGSDLEEFRNRF